MKPALILAAVSLVPFAPAPAETRVPQRALAVTIDDLPATPAGALDNAPATLEAMTEKLLATIADRRIPAIGFVNEGKLDVEGESAAERERRIAILRRWTDAGLELGNHTRSHPSLNRLPLEEYQADLVGGEPVTRALLAERGRELRYFRHPFLQVGLELDKRRAFESWLTARGYRVAPVTIDNDEWIYAALYADALRAGDGERAERLAAAYVDYMVEVFAFFERVSLDLLGREPAQILLVHANQLNADHLGALLDRVEARGYRYVTLDEALADPVWERPDTYVGAWGISWIHHWEVTERGERTPSPDPQEWVREAWERR